VVTDEQERTPTGVNQPNDVKDRRCRRTSSAAPSGGAIYGLGLIGALVWFWRRSDGGGEHVIGVLKALVWPAFLVHDAFKALHG
jgi:hypothetical protein